MKMIAAATVSRRRKLPAPEPPNTVPMLVPPPNAAPMPPPLPAWSRTVSIKKMQTST
jgi:hypothetical protein